VVPAYATDSAAITVEPKARASRGRVTAPNDPQQGVSQSEFDEMVRDIQHETAKAPVAAKSRRAAPAPEPEPEPAPEPVDDPTADARPEDLVLKDTPKRDKPKRSRNKRHGRPR
jgi:SecD/SecF fusion protein